jgi:RNA polymerase sigma-70 factor, ECF subfamily
VNQTAGGRREGGWGAGVSLDDAEAHIAAQEAQLVGQIADGNIEDPMKELYRRYAKNLYRFGLHMLGDEGLAEEMVQESFQRLWRSARRYEAGRGSVGAYIFVIARSAAADIRKRPSSRPLLPVEDFQLPPLPDSTDQILDSLILREALGKLSSAHAEVMRLALEEGLTQTAIAERLGLAVGTVKSRTFNGLRALRSALGERGFNAA